MCAVLSGVMGFLIVSYEKLLHNHKTHVRYHFLLEVVVFFLFVFPQHLGY